MYHDASFVRFDTIPECDRRTDRHLCSSNISACIANYPTTLVKIKTDVQKLLLQLCSKLLLQTWSSTSYITTAQVYVCSNFRCCCCCVATDADDNGDVMLRGPASSTIRPIAVPRTGHTQRCSCFRITKLTSCSGLSALEVNLLIISYSQRE